jgi:hypothetical protein
MTIKPAAWFYQYPGETGIFMCADAKAMEGLEEKGYILTPLYTHPANLTDEEICKIFNEYTGLGVHQKEADKVDLLVFARAILRKATEK